LQQVAEFLEVPFDPQALGEAQRRSRKPASTPSYYAVQQPIYQRAVGRWHNYAKFIGAANDIVAPFVTALRYD
jgi:hypothetical protein